MAPSKHPSDVVVIFRSSIRLKNGRTVYASQYGLKAFRLEIPAEKYRSQ